MTNYESPLEIVDNDPAAEANRQPCSDSEEIKAKFEDKLNSFSRHVLGKVNYSTQLIEKRQEEISQLDSEVEQSAQELSLVEDEFASLGGSGRLIPEAIDRAEVLYHSYLVQHRNRQAEAINSKTHTDCQDCSRHPGLVSESVSYRDFLLYGVLRLDTPQINGYDQTESVGCLLQPLDIKPPSNISNVTLKERQMPAYIPSFNSEQFDQLKQNQDVTTTSLLLHRFSEHKQEDGWASFGFGTYQTGPLDPREPAVKKVIESAADHMVLKKENRASINNLRSDILIGRRTLQDLDRKLIA